jgi:RND family efflux transporter MFP subunit
MSKYRQISKLVVLFRHYIKKYSMKKRTVIAGVVGLVVGGGIAWFIFGGSDEAPAALVTPATTVTLLTADSYANENALTLIGTVRAASEARITADRSGRVTSVPVNLGQSVAAGQVIATIENSSEQAAVLQAEGAYQAALAARAQSDLDELDRGVGVASAQTALEAARESAVSTYRSAVTTNNAAVRGTIDPFFSDPDGFIPGLTISGKGFTSELNAERVEYQDLLQQYRQQADTVSVDSDLTTELRDLNAYIDRTAEFLDTFIAVLELQTNDARFSNEQIAGFITSFSSARSNLINLAASVEASATAIENAEDAVERARIADVRVSDAPRASDAQVTQALGGLRAAQANLAKTILRTPISGTINQLSVQTGDFIGAQQQAALVANNNALEIVTYVSQAERDLLAVGDTLQVEGVTAIVTAIAPAVDQTVGKIEVRLAATSDDLQNGDTVTVTFVADSQAVVAGPVIVPLAAVKFTQNDGEVFLVRDGLLVSQPVTTGAVQGGGVVITAGLNSDQVFVADARGLQAGTAVTVSN